MSSKNRIGPWRRPTGPQPADLLYPPASPSTSASSSSSPAWSTSSPSSSSTQDKYRPLSPWNPGPGDVDGGLGPRALNLFSSTFRPRTPSSSSSGEEEEPSPSDSTPYFSSSFSSPFFHEGRPDHSEDEGLFEDFQPRTHFNLDRSITWFPPHMTKATLAIDKCYKHIDCLLEVCRHSHRHCYDATQGCPRIGARRSRDAKRALCSLRKLKWEGVLSSVCYLAFSRAVQAFSLFSCFSSFSLSLSFLHSHTAWHRLPLSWY